MQLSHVAGPPVTAKDFRHFRRDPADALPELLVEVFDVTLDEQQRVIAALA
jgi:hypothetical protein